MKRKAFSLIELSIVILVIGILIAGITQSSRLISQFKLKTARQLTSSSPVSSIPDVSMWFDATSEYAFATGAGTYTDVDTPDDQTAIGRWNDMNPRVTALERKALVQATGNNQPTYYSNAVNDLPALSYDGTNDCLASSSGNVSPSYFSSADQQVTIFLVQRFMGTSSSNTSSISWSTAVTNRFILFASWSGDIFFDSGDASDTRVTYDIPSSSNFYGKPYLISLKRNGADSELWLNTSSIASRDDAGSFVDFSTSAAFEVGGCASRFNGFISELIVFDRALNSEEQSAVESYLSKKWGIDI